MWTVPARGMYVTNHSDQEREDIVTTIAGEACKDVPREEFRNVPRQKCHQVPREIANAVTKHACTNTDIEICHYVTQEVCVLMSQRRFVNRILPN